MKHSNKAPKEKMTEDTEERLQLARNITKDYVAHLIDLGSSSKNIGIEIEMPILTADFQMPCLDLTKRILSELQETNSYKIIGKDKDGNCIALLDNETQDVITFEYNYFILEFSLAPKNSIAELKKSFSKQYLSVMKVLQKHGLILNGIGLYPHESVLEKGCLKTDYYLLVKHYLSQNQESAYNNFNGAIASVQTHISGKKDIFNFLTILQRTRNIRRMLFSNSPSSLWNINDERKTLHFRSHLWSNSQFAATKSNCGEVRPPLNTLNSLTEWFESKSLYRVLRNNQWIFFQHTSVNDYLASPLIDGYTVGKDETPQLISFVPSPGDLRFLKCYQEIELTSYGTVESRLECSNPFAFLFAPSSFLVGLLKNYDSFLMIMNGEEIDGLNLKLLNCAIEGLKSNSSTESETLIRFKNFYAIHGSVGHYIDKKTADGISYKDIIQELTGIIGTDL
jgi:gamma-glutamylcysteine synthetase